jgi:hypothetical protein
MIGDKYKYYQTLEISNDATDEEIKLSFKTLAKKWHPDKNPENEEECREKFIKIYTAYEVLTDPSAKKQYDNFLYNLKTSELIDKLLEQEIIFAKWYKKGRKEASKKYREYKTHGDDFIDTLINLSTGIVKLTGIGIKKVVKAGKTAVDKTLSKEQKEAIKGISMKTAKGFKLLLKNLFNVFILSFIGLFFGYLFSNIFADSITSDILKNVVWLGVTLAALLYYFVFKKY